MVKQIIKESMEKNPIGLKEAVESELMERLRLALEAKRSRAGDEELIFENIGAKSAVSKLQKSLQDLMKDYGLGKLSLKRKTNDSLLFVSGNIEIGYDIDIEGNVLSILSVTAKNTKTRTYETIDLEGISYTSTYDIHFVGAKTEEAIDSVL